MHDHRRLARARGSRAGARRVRRRAAARRRRGDPRQDQPQRVGQLPLARSPRAAGAARGGQTPQPLRARPQPLRLQLRLRRRGRRQPRCRRRRHRDRRLDRLPVVGERRRRHQAHGRPGQPHAASSRSRTARTPPARWRARSPTPRLLSARSPAPTRPIRRRPRRPTRRGSTTPPRWTRTASRAAHRHRRSFGCHARPDTWSLDASVAAMREQGAVHRRPASTLDAEKLDDLEFEVLLYEFKAGLAAICAQPRRRGCVSLARSSPSTSAARARGDALLRPGALAAAQAKGPSTSPAYREALEAHARIAHERSDDAFEAPPRRPRSPRPGRPGRPTSSMAITSRAAAPPCRRRGLPDRHGARRLASTACRWECRSSARPGARRG